MGAKTRVVSEGTVITLPCMHEAFSYGRDNCQVRSPLIVDLSSLPSATRPRPSCLSVQINFFAMTACTAAFIVGRTTLTVTALNLPLRHRTCQDFYVVERCLSPLRRRRGDQLHGCQSTFFRVLKRGCHAMAPLCAFVRYSVFGCCEL